MEAKQAVAYAKNFLEKVSSEAESEAEILVAHLLNVSRGSLKYTSKQIEEKKHELMMTSNTIFHFYESETKIGLK